MSESSSSSSRAPVLQHRPLVSWNWTASKLRLFTDRVTWTDLSLSLPWRSCLYMVCVSTSGSSGSLQSPRVTAEWVLLQPVTEKQPFIEPWYSTHSKTQHIPQLDIREHVIWMWLIKWVCFLRKAFRQRVDVIGQRKSYYVSQSSFSTEATETWQLQIEGFIH